MLARTPTKSSSQGRRVWFSFPAAVALAAMLCTTLSACQACGDAKSDDNRVEGVEGTPRVKWQGKRRHNMAAILEAGALANMDGGGGGGGGGGGNNNGGATNHD